VAELQNTSNAPIYIDLNTVSLGVQPELAPPEAICEWFYPAAYGPSFPSSVYLQPNDHLTVFFNAAEKADADTWKKNPKCEATRWGRMLKRLDFLPGSYSFLLTGIYYSNHLSTVDGSQPQPVTGGSVGASVSSSQPILKDEHFFSASASLPVAIAQTEIIVYAALGGLLAWLVMTFRSTSGTDGVRR
jgi:hypothetical protein